MRYRWSGIAAHDRSLSTRTIASQHCVVCWVLGDIQSVFRNEILASACERRRVIYEIRKSPCSTMVHRCSTTGGTSAKRAAPPMTSVFALFAPDHLTLWPDSNSETPTSHKSAYAQLSQTYLHYRDDASTKSLAFPNLSNASLSAERLNQRSTPHTDGP